MDFNDYDLQTQQEDLARRKQIIDALQSRAAQGTSLGDLVHGWLGNPRDGSKEMESYARDNQAYQQKHANMTQQELGMFMNKMNGTPSQPAAPDYNGESIGPPTPGMVANPREAVIRAMTSQLPEMQAMGKAAMAQLGKKPDVTEHIIGNQLVRSDKVNPPQVVGSYNKADWGEVERLGTGADGKPLFGQRNAQTGEIKYSPQGPQQINIDTKGQTKVQEAAIEALKNSREQVIGAQQQLESAQRVLQLADDPQVQTGFGAGTVNGFAALGAKLGMNGPEGVAKTQALMTDLARNTLTAGQQMKGSFSDKDIKFLSDVTAGSVNFTPETLKHMASLAYAAGHNSMLSASDQYRGASQVRGIEGADSVFPLPQTRWDATIGDRPGFAKQEGGRLRYDGDFSPTVTKPGKVNAQGRRVIPLSEFMGGQ